MNWNWNFDNFGVYTSFSDSDRIVRMKTIDGMLLCMGIEPNPGPGVNKDLMIRTFNCNGLGNLNKMRRISNS